MERTQRYSRKRDAILTALRATDRHPSAEWLYQNLKEEHPDLSMGTVYRNLNRFRQQGLIQSVGVVGGQERFDAVTSPHSHFVCDRCGEVRDLPDIRLEEDLDRTVGRQYGLTVCRHELTFHGVCPICMQKNSAEEETST